MVFALAALQLVRSRPSVAIFVLFLVFFFVVLIRSQNGFLLPNKWSQRSHSVGPASVTKRVVCVSTEYALMAIV